MTEINGYELLGLGLYFEDLPVGRKFRTIGRTLTETDLVNFIGVTGMTEVLFSNTEFLRTKATSSSGLFRARWSILLPKVFWCTRPCSTPASPSSHGTGCQGSDIRRRHDPRRMRGCREPPQRKPSEPRTGTHLQSGCEAGWLRGHHLQSAAHGQSQRHRVNKAFSSVLAFAAVMRHRARRRATKSISMRAS